MTEKTSALKKAFEEKLKNIKTVQEIDQLKVDFLGKKGSIQELMQDLRAVPNDKKREMGQAINTFKQFIEKSIEEKQAELKKLEWKIKIESTPSYDESLMIKADDGSLHPITIIQREVESIFASMGFTIENYPEIVDDYHCFEALNIPPYHPARDMQDTYYLSTGQLLKTHTSAAQNYIMRKYGAPLRAIFPGRCFRNESIMIPSIWKKVFSWQASIDSFLKQRPGKI
nr:hypothetical protein [Treponemataceae bacterium]